MLCSPCAQRPALLTHEHHSSLSVFGDLLQQLQAFPPVTVSPRHVEGLLRTQNWNRAGTQTGGHGRPSLPLPQPWMLPSNSASSHPSQGRVGTVGDMPHIRRGPAQDLDPSPNNHLSLILLLSMAPLDLLHHPI